MSIFYKLGVENKDVSSIQCDGIEMSLKVRIHHLFGEKLRLSHISKPDLQAA